MCVSNHQKVIPSIYGWNCEFCFTCPYLGMCSLSHSTSTYCFKMPHCSMCVHPIVKAWYSLLTSEHRKQCKFCTWVNRVFRNYLFVSDYQSLIPSIYCWYCKFYFTDPYLGMFSLLQHNHKMNLINQVFKHYLWVSDYLSHISSIYGWHS